MKSLTAWMKKWGIVWLPGKEEKTAGDFTEYQAYMFLECMRVHGRVAWEADVLADRLYDDYVAQGGMVA